MATLSQQIENIFTNGRSVSGITRELRALGICTREINILIDAHRRSSRLTVENITFGVEIECYNVAKEEIAQRLREAGIACYVEGYNHRDYTDHFKVVHDGSLVGENTAEVVSPILRGKSGLRTLKLVCKVLNEIGAKVNRSCGLHVHFGLADVNFETYKNIFINYARIESVIDSFMPLSRRDNIYCHTFRTYGRNLYDLLESASNQDDIASVFSDDRYFKVNPIAFRRHNTIEFRQHQGTVSYTKMANWIEFLKSLIAYSQTGRIESADSIEHLPFISDTQKRFFESRRAALA